MDPLGMVKLGVETNTFSEWAKVRALALLYAQARATPIGEWVRGRVDPQARDPYAGREAELRDAWAAAIELSGVGYGAALSPADSYPDASAVRTMNQGILLRATLPVPAADVAGSAWSANAERWTAARPVDAFGSDDSVPDTAPTLSRVLQSMAYADLAEYILRPEARASVSLHPSARDAAIGSPEGVTAESEAPARPPGVHIHARAPDDAVFVNMGIEDTPLERMPFLVQQLANTETVINPTTYATELLGARRALNQKNSLLLRRGGLSRPALWTALCAWIGHVQRVPSLRGLAPLWDVSLVSVMGGTHSLPEYVQLSALLRGVSTSLESEAVPAARRWHRLVLERALVALSMHAREDGNGGEAEDEESATRASRASVVRLLGTDWEGARVSAAELGFRVGDAGRLEGALAEGSYGTLWKSVEDAQGAYAGHLHALLGRLDEIASELVRIAGEIGAEKRKLGAHPAPGAERAPRCPTYRLERARQYARRAAALRAEVRAHLRSPPLAVTKYPITRSSRADLADDVAWATALEKTFSTLGLGRARA